MNIFRKTDPCDTSDINFQKGMCNKVAVFLGDIKSGCSLTFNNNSPRCVDIKMQLQTKNGSRSVQNLLLYCDAKEAHVMVGLGQTENGLHGWSCEDTSCYPAKEVPNVFKCADTLA